MRAWLYDHLTLDPIIQGFLGGTLLSAQSRIFPRESMLSVNAEKPYLVYGLGNDSNEDLSEDPGHEAHRQFFQIWIHDEGGSYDVIDDMIPVIKASLQNASDPASNVTTVRWLETSQEFSNETLNTIFRYIRFQAIISKGVLIT